MLTLDLPTTLYWIDLPRGVRVEVKPVTTTIMAAAQAATARRLSALREAEPELDPDLAKSLAFVLLGKGAAAAPPCSTALPLPESADAAAPVGASPPVAARIRA